MNLDWQLEFVDVCYGATLVSEARSLDPVLKLVVDHVGAAAGILQRMDPRGPTVEGIASWGLHEQFLTEYVADFAHDDPWLTLFLSHDLEWGRAASTGAEIDIRPVLNTRYYNELWARWGLGHTSGTFVRDDVGRLLNLGLPRAADAGPLPRQHYADVSFATQHLLRTVAIQQRMSLLQERSERRQSVLDRLDFGLIILGTHGQIRVTNRCSEGLFKSGTLLSRNGQLHFSDTELDARIRHELRLSRSLASTVVLNPPDPFLIRNAEGKRWVTYVLPWRNSAMDAWALLFFDENNRKRSPTMALSILGHLTLSETAVLEWMLQGSTVREIANQRCTGFETVRSQVKSVLHKLGLHTQSELQRLAARFSPPFAERERP
ncbi:MAG: helix-turn-helix transcriptional regulator [Planctomycetales bacterium]|nr:helix-turn-helix transcriptional regulator [Planctomycetales bacterium]